MTQTPTDAEAAAEEFVNKYGLYGQMSNPPLKTAAESFLIGFAAGLEKGRAEGGKWPTREQQYRYLKEQRDAMLDNMEGTNAEEFVRWEKLYCAYADIVADLEKNEPLPPSPTTRKGGG